MTKVLCTFNFGKEKIEKLSELGYEIIIENEKNLVYSDKFKDVECLIAYDPYKSFDISKLTNLKWIQTLSDGINQIPKEKIENDKITITNNKDGYSIPIAEWIVCNVLSLYKNSMQFYRNKENKIWKMDNSLMEIYGHTIGIIGTGTIAIETAKRFKGFGVNLLGLNTNGRDIEYFNECYSNSNYSEMISQCDVVICLLPITEKTYHFINEDLFSKMKDGVIFVNASRGDVVDENKLIENIKSGKIKAAALDVFENEPLTKENPLWNFDNVIITPHNSWISQHILERRYKLVYENMFRYKKNEKLLNIVNINRGY